VAILALAAFAAFASFVEVVFGFVPFVASAQAQPASQAAFRGVRRWGFASCDPPANRASQPSCHALFHRSTNTSSLADARRRRHWPSVDPIHVAARITDEERELGIINTMAD
jgi:hypothetical protein